MAKKRKTYKKRKKTTARLRFLDVMQPRKVQQEKVCRREGGLTMT